MTTYVEATEVRPGDKLVADGGFECLTEGQVVEVQVEPRAWGKAPRLFVACNCGQHFLEGQLDMGHYLGFTKTEGK